MEKKTEIRNLLERLRIAWEKRPEMSFANMVMQIGVYPELRGKRIGDTTDDVLITAIEKLCNEVK